MKNSLLSLFLLLLTACNFIPQQPRITDLWAKHVGFEHTLNLTECGSCHSSARPIEYTNAYLNLNSPDHFASQDCMLCHQTIDQTTTAWKPFNHKNNNNNKVGLNSAGQVVLDCNTCHEQNRPLLVAGGGSHQATGSCGSCHIYPDQKINPRSGWLPAFMGHTPTPASCTACHTQDKPIGTVPNKFNGFDHASMWGTECKTCHLSNIGVSWSGGYFDHGANGSIVRSVTCSPCHDQRQHESGQLCSRCHSPLYPTGGGGGQWDEP